MAKEVKVRELHIQALIKRYESAYSDIVKTITTASEAGKINKAKTMASIKADLQSLGVDVDKWVKKEIPQYYSDGANQAVQDLKKMGYDVTSPKGLNATSIQAINSLVDETSLAFADGLTTIARNARGILSKALRQQLNFIIADGKLKGEALKTVTSGIKQALKDNGLVALKDRAGRSWTFDRYAEMLARTKVVEARNTGMADKMVQNGYDLVQVSDHNSTHKACAVWENKILSVTGATPTGKILPGGYKVAGTVQEATEAGLLHPNCKHAINPLVPELAAKTKAYNPDA